MAVKLMFSSCGCRPNFPATSTTTLIHVQGIKGRKSVTTSCKLWNATRIRPSLKKKKRQWSHKTWLMRVTGYEFRNLAKFFFLKNRSGGIYIPLSNYGNWVHKGISFENPNAFLTCLKNDERKIKDSVVICLSKASDITLIM